MRSCKFVFDDGPAFDGFAYGSTWNGFDNVAVTPAVLDQIKQHFADSPESTEAFAGLEVDADGLVSLGWGFSTQIVEAQQ